MPNKPTTLREELIKLLFLEIDAIANEDDYRQYILSEEEIHKLIERIENLAVSSHNTELLRKIEAKKDEYKNMEISYDKDIYITELPDGLIGEMNGLKKGIEVAFNEVIKLINQEK